MRTVTQTRQLDAADPNAIAEDQTTVGAGNLVLDGVLVVGGVAVMDASREIELESAGNLSGVNFTITGTNAAGQTVSETLAGPNAATVQTVREDWATVTQIAVDAAVGTNVEVGTSGIGASTPIPLDQYISPFNVSLGIDITGVVDVTAQYTFDDVFEENNFGPFTWINHPDLTNVAVDSDGTFISPVTACRLRTNSGVGTAVMRTIQAGLT